MRHIKKFSRLSIRRQHKGFTLIELLIVVGVLGILAAIAIPSISNFLRSGDVAAMNTELASVQSAAVAYAVENPDETGGFYSTSFWSEDGTNNYLNKPPEATYHFDSQGALDETPTTPTGKNIRWNDTTDQWEADTGE